MRPETPAPTVRMVMPGARFGFPGRNQSGDLTGPARAVALGEPAVLWPAPVKVRVDRGWMLLERRREAVFILCVCREESALPGGLLWRYLDVYKEKLHMHRALYSVPLPLVTTFSSGISALFVPGLRRDGYDFIQRSQNHSQLEEGYL